MKTIHTSKLIDLKSVFNSEIDNLQYYKVLYNANCTLLNNVELAKPIVKKSKGIIEWQSEKNLDLYPINSYNQEERIKLGNILEVFFKDFKNKVSKYNNIPKDFVKDVMQIPDLSSIYVSPDHGYLVIVNWGFLEDKFNRKEGVIETLFPIPNQSILVQLVNENNEPLEGYEIGFNSRINTSVSKTNANGYANFGTLTRGENFTILLKNKFSTSSQHEFLCDGSEKYVLKINENITIQIIVKDSLNRIVKDLNLIVDSTSNVSKTYNTKDLGKFKFSEKANSGNFSVSTKDGVVLLNEEVPKNDSTFEIKFNNQWENKASAENKKEDLNKNKAISANLTFVNLFKRPIKNMTVDINDGSNNSTYVTDDLGQINLKLNSSNKINYSFNRYKKTWEGFKKIDAGSSNIIKVVPIFPWLWWIILLMLTVLLFCCLFTDCFCSKDYKNNNSNITHDEVEQIQAEVTPCNQQTVSGGDGVTSTKHTLGNKSGEVVIQYNMQNIPDKMEVFYENELVASTFSIPNNIDGFVGNSITGSSGVGEIKFYYVKEKVDYIEIIVTGSDANTAWEYLVKCPV